MPVLIAPDQPPDPPIWGLIIAMIAASPNHPWVWVALLVVGVVLSDRRRT